MVQSPAKRRLYFAAFVLPAFALYFLFFIFPFGKGLAISFTNWDGLTPKSPISMSKEQFKSRILNKITSPSDRAFLLSIYSLTPEGDAYARLSIRGLARNRVERIMRNAGYQPENYRSIGLKNYSDIFTGRIDARFYPRHYTKVNYKETSDLPAEIPAADVQQSLLSKLTAEEKESLDSVYQLNGSSYKLKPEADEFAIEDLVWQLPPVSAGTVDSSAVDNFFSGLQEASERRDRNTLETALSGFCDSPQTRSMFSTQDRETIRSAAEKIYSLGSVKHILSTKWVQSKFDLGVIGFTLFFAVLTVLFSNLLAFLLAMALDTKIRTRNILRSVFFLPNVLSMIVVALIWSIMFSQLLPYITGIDLWMGDPDKAPWLVVLVAVWQMAGYYMIIYLAGLQNIPTDIIEAAKIDGARGSQVLRYITLPLLTPAITVCLFLSTANALKCFDLVYALVGPSGYALGTVPFVMDIYFDAFANKLVGLATAKATILFLVILLVTGIQLAIMKRREVQA